MNCSDYYYAPALVRDGSDPSRKQTGVDPFAQQKIQRTARPEVVNDDSSPQGEQSEAN